jgi:hypothetical protein
LTRQLTGFDGDLLRTEQEGLLGNAHDCLTSTIDAVLKAHIFGCHIRFGPRNFMARPEGVIG